MKIPSNTIFLHVGSGKTATTSIQAAIPPLRCDLEAAGLRAPLDPSVPEELEFRPRVGSGYSFALAKLLNPRFKMNKPFNVNESWNWLESEFKRAQVDRLNLLFSSEALQYSHESPLLLFKDLAMRYGFQVKILFYARTALDYSISEYLQHLKTGFTSYSTKNLPTSLSTYIASTIIPFGSTLSTFANIFGKESMEVRNFDNVKASILNDFFAAVSGSSFEFQKFRQQNRSLSRNEQEALEMLLKRKNGPELCQRIGNKLIQTPSTNSAPETYFVNNESIRNYTTNNDPIVDYVNGYLPKDEGIFVLTTFSRIATESTESCTEYKPNWHETYARIIETLL